ncbi:MAG: NADH-quinone oxidoreductase subunit J [Deltaproteobacteria bacterium]|nr:NADH-quinone oxidoreductase subunit J [Deltaproteobacteria bacterium]
MLFTQIVFWLLAVGVIVSAGLVVVGPGGKNPLYGAIALILSFFFIAGIYVLTLAHTMAILQILVYAGAIMVLFMFVIMLLNLSKKELGDETKTVAKGVGIIATLAIAIKMIVVVDARAELAAKPLPADFGTVGSLGDLLFRDYLVPFELTGILLLVAVIGAVVLAKRTL